MISSIIVTFLLIVAYLILFIQGRNGIVILLISLGEKKRRLENISHLKLYPPDKLQATIDTLTKLGFSRLGETRIKISGVKTLDSWVFVSSDKFTTTDLGETIPNLVFFNSAFIDNAMVETGFPYGENIETPHFRSRVITSNIEDAYIHQTKQIEDFSKKHGAPRRIETMNDYLYWDIIFREQYSWLKFRRNTLIGIINIISLGYSIVSLLIVIGFLLSPRNNLTTTHYYKNLLFLLIAIAPAVLISLSTPFIAFFSMRQETKPD